VDRRAHALVAGLLLGWAGLASAFYTSVTPPAGVSATSAASNAIANAQASSKFTNTVTKIPVAIRVGAGAARIAARAIVGGGVVGAAVVGAAWLAENCFEKQGGQWVRTCFNDQPQSDGFYYGASFIHGGGVSNRRSWAEVCAAAVAAYNQWGAGLEPPAVATLTGSSWPSNGDSPKCSNTVMRGGSPWLTDTDLFLNPTRSTSPCPAGWYYTDQGCVATPQPQPVTPQQIEDEMAPKPVPPAVWPELVPTQVPIELPTLNPDPADPSKPMPWKEPSGNPVPIPDTNPQRYKQPWVTIKPAPTQTDPWRVDVQPESTETNSPNPVGPDGIAGPQTNNDQKKPEDKEPDLCEKHPDIIACQKLEFDTPDAPDLEQKERGGPITPDSGWGPDDAACPAPRHVVVQGRDIPIPFDLFCHYMSGLRPVILAMAWLAAAFIFVGGIRSGD